MTFARRAAKALLNATDRIIGFGSAVGTEAFLDPHSFEWVSRLETDWRRIRAEVDVLLQNPDDIPSLQDIAPDQRVLTTDDRWKTFFLYGFGHRIAPNCERCPETAQLIAPIPGLSTAFFSVLLGGKTIPEHRGLYRGFLRYHLGLVIPDPPDACGIRVGGQVRHWEEGKSLLFDDTYLHEAWNHTDRPRVVLFMDVVRPMRPPVAWLNRALIAALQRSPYVREARRNQERYDRDRRHRS